MDDILLSLENSEVDNNNDSSLKPSMFDNIEIMEYIRFLSFGSIIIVKALAYMRWIYWLKCENRVSSAFYTPFLVLKILGLYKKIYQPKHVCTLCHVYFYTFKDTTNDSIQIQCRYANLVTL